MRKIAIEVTMEFVTEVDDDVDIDNESDLHELLSGEAWNNPETSSTRVWEIDDEGLSGDLSDANRAALDRRQLADAYATLDRWNAEREQLRSGG